MAQSPPSSSSPAALRADLERNGFIVIRALFPPSQIELLRAAASRATSLARAGKWPHVRTVGKQFPPWDASHAVRDGIWGVQHLMNPSLSSGGGTSSGIDDARTFASVYFSDATLSVVTALLDCTDDDLVMELFNMLVRPDRDFSLRWHRDDIPPQATDEEELARLLGGGGGGKAPLHAQYNLALYDDASLVVVPGSHRRARTAEERGADPFEDRMPGQLVVELGPGDVVFYDNNILHRGVYEAGKERMTLHGSVGHVRGKKARARNVLQHGVGAWVGECDFSGLGDDDGGGGGDGVGVASSGAGTSNGGGINNNRLGQRAEAMRKRLVELGKEDSDVGYSLEG